MEIEAKPVVPENYTNRPVDLLVSAYSIGCANKSNDEWLAFLKNARRMFLEDMQAVAEIAFKKGREFERKNSSQPEQKG